MNLKSIIAILFAVIVGFTSCSNPSADAERLTKLAAAPIKEGKELLSQGAYSAAKAKFNQVLTEIDFTNSEARFGYVISDLLGFADLIRTINGLTGSLSVSSVIEPQTKELNKNLITSLINKIHSDLGTETKFSSSAEDENLFVRDVVVDLVTDLHDKFADIDTNLMILIGTPGSQFRIDTLPVYLTSATTPTLDMSKEWDRADAALLDGLTQGILGLLNFILSIDLKANYLGTYDYLSNDIGMDNLNAATIMNILVYILNDKNYPNFLGLEPEQGYDKLRESGINFSTAIQMLMYSFYFMSIEDDQGTGQDDDIIKYENTTKLSFEERFSAKDNDSCKALEGMTEEEKDSATAKYIFNFILDKNGKRKPMEMESTPRGACLFQRLKESFDYTDGKDTKIWLMSDLVPMLLDMIGDSVSLPSGIDNNTITSILGDPIAFEFGAFFENPVGLRTLFPAWDVDKSPEDNYFILEKECHLDGDDYYGPATNETSAISQSRLVTEATDPRYYRAVNNLFCLSKSGSDPVITDMKHFSTTYVNFSTLKEIPEDGFQAIGPYISFQDASFNGMLWLNMSDTDHFVDYNKMKNADLVGTGLQKANIFSLNTLLTSYINLAGTFAKDTLAGLNRDDH